MYRCNKLASEDDDLKMNTQGHYGMSTFHVLVPGKSDHLSKSCEMKLISGQIFTENKTTRVGLLIQRNSTNPDRPGFYKKIKTKD